MDNSVSESCENVEFPEKFYF